jgi:D-glycero-alpha-D-manno-heptose 1-phosphate guanylyltransferase
MQIPEILVLAGGFGTRLKSVSGNLPKPLVPVAGTPFLHHLVDNWYRQGARKFLFLLHHEAAMIKARLDQARSENRWPDSSLRCITEATPLGTAGAVAHAISEKNLKTPFLVANADTWIGSGLLDVAKSEAPAIATILIKDTGRYGRVKIENGLVVAFEEKQAASGSGRINAGLYKLLPSYFKEWHGLASSLECDVFPKLIEKGQVQATQIGADFIDIGIPEDYQRFCRWVEQGRKGHL